jgi:hypothetical protein
MSGVEIVKTLCNEMCDDATTVFNDKVQELTKKYVSKQIDKEKFITTLDEYISFYKNFCEKINRVNGLYISLDSSCPSGPRDNY